MQASTTNERLEFINALDIHKVSNTAAAQDTANVVAGSALYFVQSVSKTMKDDVINSTLLAQLAANKKYDRQANKAQWYGYYTQVLGQLGWVVQEFSLTEMNNVGAYPSMDQLILKYSATFLTGGQLGQFTSMINALKETKNKKAESILNAQSSYSKSANFQLGLTFAKDGNPYVSIAGFAYTSSKEIGRVLFDPITDPKMAFYAGKLFDDDSCDADYSTLGAGHQTMFLDENLYSQVRQSVLEKLSAEPLDKLVCAIQL
ncbi:hypothetical protein ONZ51_g8891 [Trametes cubensis]|uniref:Uncharacterized protein n=1 Tax=Trametes cubensis TaxID=1111947 RepID=A0AAD7TMU1_9APHY|nr:hypothetical protein ONZ51_g8891 [Trametes cubensis]